MNEVAPDISDLVLAAERQSKADVGDDLRKALSRLLEDQDTSREALIITIAEVLPSITSGHGAGTVAVWLGAQVEHGYDPKLSAEAVRKTWLRWSRTIKTEDAAQQAIGPEGAFYAIEDCSRSLVSHCSADDQILSRLQCDQEFRGEVARLIDDSSGAAWLDQLLKQTSGELLVLDMMNKRGAVLCYRHLSNCFHLFTLLQGALKHWLPLDKRPTQSVLNRASVASDESTTDFARWHFQQPLGVTPNLACSVWGEGHLDEIQSVDGQRVVTLWPILLKSRSWDDGFFTPLLCRRPPTVEVIRELDLMEFNSWWERLAQISPKEPIKSEAEPSNSIKYPWWMFWRK